MKGVRDDVGAERPGDVQLRRGETSGAPPHRLAAHWKPRHPPTAITAAHASACLSRAALSSLPGSRTMGTSMKLSRNVSAGFPYEEEPGCRRALITRRLKGQRLADAVEEWGS